MSKEVGSRVHQPRGMQAQHVAKSSSDPHAVPEGLSSRDMGEGSGKHEAHQQGQQKVVLVLDHDDGVILKVGNVELSPCLGHLECRRGGRWGIAVMF